MKSFVITLYGHPYSEAVSERCAISARETGKIQVQRFDAITKDHALDLMSSLGLRWTWAGKPYPGPLAPRVGCAMSHFLLWRQCVQEDQPILILEHDAVFIREMPEIEFDGICQINDPRGCTPKGAWWSDYFSMMVFGYTVYALVTYLGGLMAVDICSRKATGAAMGVIGLFSYAGATLQEAVGGYLIDAHKTIGPAGQTIYNFGAVGNFWVIASGFALLLPLFVWNARSED
jgi:hypothetical protein